MAVTHSTPTLQKAHNCFTRALRHAEGRDLVRRNVSALVEIPHGREARPSQALILDQAAALLKAAEDSRLHAYIVLCLLTGVRNRSGSGGLSARSMMIASFSAVSPHSGLVAALPDDPQVPVNRLLSSHEVGAGEKVGCEAVFD